MYINKNTILQLQNLPIEQVAGDLGLRPKGHKALCPFHDDTHASLTFNTQRNCYRCYVCNSYGNSIDLVKNSLNISFVDACSWLSQQYGISIEGLYGPQISRRVLPRNVVNPQSSATPSETIVTAYLERLMCQPILNEPARTFLFDERKLSPQVIAQLGISSISYNCPMSSSPHSAYFDGPALLIPYRDIHGKLMSVQSRYLGTDKKPRFRFPKGNQCHIFNMPALRDLKPNEPLFITEGTSDCMAIMSAGFKSIAIPSATLLKPEDVKLLQGHTTADKPRSPLNLHMYPDNDEPGEKLFHQLKELCPTLVRHDLPRGYKDVGQYWASIHQQ